MSFLNRHSSRPRQKIQKPQYFIDGYNLLFRLCKVDGELKKAREVLVRWLASFPYSLTLVFDGKRTDQSDFPYHIGQLSIVYTCSGQSADEYLIEMMLSGENRKQAIVVTSDTLLGASIKGIVVEVMSIDLFFSMVKKKERKKQIESSGFFRESETQMEQWIQIFEERMKKEEVIKDLWSR